MNQSVLFFLAEHAPIRLLEGTVARLVENIHFQVHLYVLDRRQTVLLVLLVLALSLILAVHPIRILDLPLLLFLRLADVLRCRPKAKHRRPQSLDFAGLGQVGEIGVQQGLLSLDPLVGVVSQQPVQQVNKLFGRVREKPTQMNSLVLLEAPVLGLHMRGVDFKLVHERVGGSPQYLVNLIDLVELVLAIEKRIPRHHFE